MDRHRIAKDPDAPAAEFERPRLAGADHGMVGLAPVAARTRTPGGQAAFLADRTVPVAMRQMVARRIAGAGGNRHLQAVLARDAAKDSPERAQEAERLRGLIPNVEQATGVFGSAESALRSFSLAGVEKADAISGCFGAAAATFRAAYAEHARVVELDNQEMADAQAMMDAVMGIAIGVASAYTCVPLAEAALTAGKVLAEVSERKWLLKLVEKAAPAAKPTVESLGEVGEWAASKVKEGIQNAAGPAKPDARTPDVMELEQARQLIKLYRDLAVIQAKSEVGRFAGAGQRLLLEIERYGEERNQFPANELEGMAAELTAAQGIAAELQAAIAAADAGLDSILQEARARQPLNSQREIEKDIWTRWLAAGNDPGPRAKEKLQALGIVRFHGFLTPASIERGGPEARAQRGKRGTAVDTLDPEGEVLVDGKPWAAAAPPGQPIPAGSAIRVTGLRGIPPRSDFGGPPIQEETQATLLVDWADWPPKTDPGQEPNQSLPEPDHSG
jgi:hypothetical protein